MFLGIEWGFIGIISISFVIIIFLIELVAIIYLWDLILLTIRYRTKIGLMDLQNLFLDEKKQPYLIMSFDCGGIIKK